MELIDGVFTHFYTWCTNSHDRAKYRFFTFKNEGIDLVKCEVCGDIKEEAVSSRILNHKVREKVSVATADLFDHLRTVRNTGNGIEIGFTYDPAPNSKRIRLDFEVNSDYLTNEEMTDLSALGGMYLGKAVWPMAQLFINDMADLFLNGDTNSTDPLLQVLDGAYKTGIVPDPKFGTFNIYKEFKPMKDTYEITMYTRVAV